MAEGQQVRYDNEWPIYLSPSKSLKETGKLQCSDGNQWIERNADPNSLPYSAVFVCDGIPYKLHGLEHLLTSGANYLSYVKVHLIVELDDSVDFEEAIKILRRHIKLDPVLRSRNHDACDRAERDFEKCLSSVSSKALEHSDTSNALLQLCRFFKYHNYQLPTPLVDTSGNQDYRETLNAAKDYFEAKTSLLRPEIILNAEQFEDSEDEFIKSALKKLIYNYQQQLLLHCTTEFTKKITRIENENIFLISLEDIELFSDLEKIMTVKRFKEALKIIRGNYLMEIMDISEESVPGSRNMSNRIYYFVLKSLMEVSSKLRDILRLGEVVTYGIKKWTVVNIPKDHKQSLLEESLRQQLNMLVMLVNHYEPGTKTVHQRMTYNFKYVTIKNHLPDYVHICFCILDDSFGVFISRNIQAGSVIYDLQLLKIFNDHISSGYLTNATMESLSSITQHLLHLLGQSFTMIIDTENPTACEILQKQVSILERGLTLIELRDYLNVFNSCWELCSRAFQNIACRLSGVWFAQRITRIQSMLLQVISLVLDETQNLLQLIDFLKKFEGFLIGLSKVDLSWYVRLQENQSKNEAIELVDNKWKETEHQCFIVKSNAVDKFTAYFDKTTMPKHYQLTLLECFLENIIRLANKLTHGIDQLDTLFLFITAISSRFPHFQQLPDYIDFETFLSENAEPFQAAVENNASLEKIKKRTLRIKDSFRCTRNTNIIGIDRTLKLLLKGNPTINVKILKDVYTIYRTCFKEHTVGNTSLNCIEEISQIMESVQSKIKPLLFSSWSEEFKQKVLPEIVAALAAAWSMMASEGTTSSDAYIIPHIVQILCILRLLSVDQCSVGVAKQLAQVSAGEGKSMILALTAALLALFGHNVSIICCSRYLAKRDAVNFQKLFQLLNVSNRISYNTINDMMENHAMDHTDRNGDSTLDRMGLPKKILSKPNQNKIRVSNSVLLMDEVDAFLADKIFGNSRVLTIQPLILGLDVVQLKIWHLIQTGDTNCTSIVAKIYKFVRASNDTRVYNLRRFIENSQKYSILIQGREELVESVVTNRTLYSKHLRVMVLSALKVHREPINGSFISNYKLDEEERITCRNRLGEFTPSFYKGYYNAFVYFKLKGNNFVQNVSQCKNYGYFIICVGELSYQQLLASHPLILGVTGDLMALNSSEVHAIKNHYKIQKDTFMPSSFGSLLLKFNEVNDFKCISTEAHWMNTVINRINTIISTERSVLVFFDTEGDINKFKQKLSSQLDRLNILTVDTEAETKEQYINDAGAAKTVTLATREMGRGVDFKSGTAVETKRGLHVIQTFFSLDVKEETLIMGRTARKGCHGSFEQIVCYEHVVNLQLIYPNTKCDFISYAQLDRARKSMVKKNCEAMAKKLALANVKHGKTIEFYSS